MSLGASDFYPDSKLVHLLWIGSDHCPLLLQIKTKRPKIQNTPFRFHKFWLSYDDIKEVVQGAWRTPSTEFHSIRFDSASLKHKTGFASLEQGFCWQSLWKNQEIRRSNQRALGRRYSMWWQ